MIDVPILFLHAEDDWVVPYRQYSSYYLKSETVENTFEKVLKSNVRLGRTLYEAATEQRPSSWPEVSSFFCDCSKSNFPRWNGADSQGAEVMHTITSAELQSCQKYSGPQIPPSKHNASFILARIHITRLQVLITYYVFFRNFQERCKSEISPKMQDEAEDLSDGHGADGDYHNDQDGANLHYY